MSQPMSSQPHKSEQEVPTINIRTYLMMALGGSSYLRPIIDETYAARRWEYYEAYRSSEAFGDLRFLRQTTKNEAKMKQVAGIVEWCYLHNDFNLIYKLIKKGYKFSYQYFTQQKGKTINLDHFSLAYTKRRGGLEEVSDLELYYAAIVVVYLCVKENESYTINNQYGRLFAQGMQDAIMECIGWSRRFSDEHKALYKTQIDEMFEAYGILRNMKPTTLGKFFEWFIEKQMERHFDHDPFQNVSDVRTLIFQEGISKYIGSISNWVKVNGINEMDLTESIELTKEDVEIVFMDFIIAKQDFANHLSDQDRDLYIVSTLYLYAVIKEYKVTKQLYLDESQEQHYVEMKEREKNIQQKEAILEKLETDSKANSQRQEERIRVLEEELRKAQKGLQQAQSELEKREDHSKEVGSLRSFVYELNKPDETPQKLTLKEMVERIQSKKIAVIGGHPNWANNMQEALPKVRFADVDSLNRDISYVDNMDIVFVYTGILKHKYYRNLMTRMNTNRARLCYLSNLTNVELTLMEMEKMLT